MGFLTKALSKAAGSYEKTPAETVAQAREALQQLAPNPSEKAVEHLNKYLQRTRSFLQGTQERQVVPEHVQEGVSAVLSEPTFLNNMISKLPLLEFEARKDAVYILHAVMHHRETKGAGAAFSPGAEYFAQNEQLLHSIASGYQNLELALNYGSMLRECVHHEKLARIVLYSPSFLQFFKWVELKEFEVASDAFATLKELLVLHKELVAEFLQAKYNEFFGLYGGLLNSDNYVTRRLSIKLLGELLLVKENSQFMVKYVNNVENLKTMMNFLRDTSKSIQFEAFHVFKVFVANPNRQQAVVEVLLGNRDKLIRYLQAFHEDRDDKQFQEEKAVVVTILQKLTPV